MLYTPPTGSTDPNAGYVGKDVSAGRQGSKVPAAAIEASQREIVAAITAAGLTPTNNDYQQLVKAVRGGTLTYFRDTGLQNAPVVTPSPVFIALSEGNTFRIKAAFAPTGDSALRVNSLTPVQIRKSGNNVLTGGEWAAGDVITVCYDGFYFQFLGAQGSSSLIATSTITMNVPSQYSSIRAALLAAGLLVIAPNVYVIIQVAPNYVESLTAVTGPLYLSHPYGQRIKIIGPPLSGAYPSYAELAGLSNANTLTLLRSRFNARIEAIGTNALELHSGALNSVENLLFVGDGTASGGHYGWLIGNWSGEVGMGSIGTKNCFVHGFGLDNVRAEQTSVIQGNNLGSTYATAHAFHISHDSTLECNFGNILGMYSQSGIVLQNTGLLAIDSSSGTADFSNNQDGIASDGFGNVNAFSCTSLNIKNNSRYGVNMQRFCHLGLPVNGGTTFAGNGTLDINLNLSSEAATLGCALPKGSSPTRGSGYGNNQSIVY